MEDLLVKRCKGLGKNKMIIKGNPLCLYPMEAASKSKFVTNSFLNTDDVELCEAGSIVIFLERSPNWRIVLH